MRLSAIDVGSGPAVMLLHGQPGTAADWRSVVDLLGERFRVIAPDRPGYGRTGGSAGGFAANAAAALELLDRLDVEAAVIAGHSWATGAAIAIAISSPQRTRALVLAAPVAPGIAPGPLDRALANPLLGIPAALIGFPLAGLALAARPLRRIASGAMPALSTQQIAAAAAQWRRAGVWRSFYLEQRALVAELPSLAPALSSMARPTTILQGTRDRISRPGHARWLARALPRAELLAAEGAGHMLPQQHPALVAEAIARAAA